MNFLLHLDDCQQEAQRGIREAEGLLQLVTQYVSQHAKALEVRATEIEEQLKGLDEDLQKLRAMLKDSREMVGRSLWWLKLQVHADAWQIKEQMDLRTFGLSLILTFVASIYLPFSFIAVRGGPCVPVGTSIF